MDFIAQFDRAIFIDKDRHVQVANDDVEIRQIIDHKVKLGELIPYETEESDIEELFFFGDMVDDSAIQQVKPVAVPVQGKRDSALNFYLVKSVSPGTVIACISFTCVYAMLERAASKYLFFFCIYQFFVLLL